MWTDRDDNLHLYCARDVYTQMVSARGVKRWIEEDGTAHQHAIDTRLAPRVRDMAELGFCIDTRTRDRYRTILHERLADLLYRLRGLTWQEFNPRSVHQVRRYLYKEQGITPLINTDSKPWEKGDDPSTNSAALTAISDTLRRPGKEPGDVETFCETLISYRALEKVRSSYVDNLILYPDPRLPAHLRRLWTGFNLHVVPSGRLSSSGPLNFQNWPKLGLVNLRQMVTAPPGHVLVSIDFEQLEARLYAVATKDELYLRAFREGLDVHALNAAVMFLKRGEDVMDVYAELRALKDTDKGRYDYLRLCAKKFGFSKQYGAEWRKVYSTMIAERDPVDQSRTFPHLEESEARGWDRNWRKYHPSGPAWEQGLNRFLRANGYVAEPHHFRRRYFRGGPNKPDAPANHRIQSWASALTNEAFLKITDSLPRWTPWTGLIAQVHDEIVAQVPRDRAQETADMMRDAFEYEIEGVRIYGEPEITETWTGATI